MYSRYLKKKNPSIIDSTILHEFMFHKNSEFYNTHVLIKPMHMQLLKELIIDMP